MKLDVEALCNEASERGVSVSLAWGCAELLYRGSSPDMKKENCGVKRSAKTVCRANKQKL
ncbi:hypothetical protein T01_12998 [Trichinella spiralis]|uniref:Uncharacterized protein n=1 Tax=Trichinella spiralis TaxID=6334 RepID=A0A0V1B709_TRISP|nr:hypothetical protein T01_12998 [Trichinella spiralis]